MFCPLDKCPHYSEATKYPRKCYYEPQCLRGYADIFFGIIDLWLKEVVWPWLKTLIKGRLR